VAPGSNSNSSSPTIAVSPIATGTGIFITDDGYLISNYHVVKDATKVSLLTGAGLIDAKVLQMDGTNAGGRELVSWAPAKNYG
jgi:S1-C subfamily serine protease